MGCDLLCATEGKEIKQREDKQDPNTKSPFHLRRVILYTGDRCQRIPGRSQRRTRNELRGPGVRKGHGRRGHRGHTSLEVVDVAVVSSVFDLGVFKGGSGVRTQSSELGTRLKL